MSRPAALADTRLLAAIWVAICRRSSFSRSMVAAVDCAVNSIALSVPWASDSRALALSTYSNTSRGTTAMTTQKTISCVLIDHRPGFNTAALFRTAFNGIWGALLAK